MASTIGDILREARRGKGETLSDAARQTGVRETHLAALERDELGRLGVDPVYVRGIIRSYAEHLGLDVASVLHEYPAGIAAAAAATSVPAAAPSRPPDARAGDRDGTSGRSRRTLAAVLAAVLLLVIVVGATALVLNVRGGDEVATTGAAEGTQATAPADPSSEPSAEATRDSRLLDIPQGGTPDSLTMKLEFTEKVWVRVLVDGQNKLEGIMRPGAVTQFTGKRRIDLRIGVAEAVSFSLNGAYYDNIASDKRGPVDVSCTVDASCRVVQEG